MNETLRKLLYMLLVALLIFIVGYYLGSGRQGVLGDGRSDAGLDKQLNRTQAEQREATDAIDAAGRENQSARETADAIRDGNRDSKETSKESGAIIDRLDRLLQEIQGQKREN